MRTNCHEDSFPKDEVKLTHLYKLTFGLNLNKIYYLSTFYMNLLTKKLYFCHAFNRQSKGK